MTCAEAREAMSGLLAGRLGLTEWAELEAHTAACEVCDRALDLRYHDIFEERMERERPVASRAGRAARRAGIGVAAVLALGALGVYAAPRLLPEISGTLRGLRLPELAGDVLDSLTASLSRVASTPAPSPARPAQDPRMASSLPVASAPAPPARPAEDSRAVSTPPVVSMPTPPPARPTEDSPAVSVPPTASAPATALPTPAPTPPLAAPSPPAVATRPPTSPSALPPRPAAPRRPVRAPEQKATAQKPVKERSVAQTPRVQDERPRAVAPRPLTDARADVIAQLSVQDRQEARRDIGLLLARLGGSRKAEKDSTVWLVVPRSRYGEFTRGLAQIGSWQMEQGSNALPDPVAVTVILTR
jgi:hypothetical protein